MVFIRFNSEYLRRVLFFRNHSTIASLLVKDVITIKPFNRTLALRGWVQAVRKHKGLVFIDLIDGSSLDRLQVIIQEKEDKPPPSYGSSISVQGVLLKSEHKGQEVELHCNTWHTIGHCSEDYPFLARHHYSPDYIRQLQHLRPKTRTFKSVLRVRNAASMAVHSFFQDRDFLFIHTPIITLNDCEGGGDVFFVEPRNKDVSEETADDVSLNQLELEQHSRNQSANLSADKIDETVDEKSRRNEFFKYPAFLTVSGQFHLESMTGAIPKVYNFGPTFRAEKGISSCHLSEFSMIEAEVAFFESLSELTKLVECLLKNVITHVMDTCSTEMDQICLKYTRNHKEYLSKLLSTPFLSLSYSEALEILEKHRKSLKVQMKWGEDLGSEHKKFIIRYCNNVPVFITEFPASIKPFYMKTDKDGKGLCFDLFAPFGSEICSGSLREESFKILEKRLENQGIIKSLKDDPGEKKCSGDPRRKENLEDFQGKEIFKDPEVTDPLSWYLEIRKYGSVPHGGFGIGFDRALQTILGIPNIRDVVPFHVGLLAT